MMVCPSWRDVLESSRNDRCSYPPFSGCPHNRILIHDDRQPVYTEDRFCLSFQLLRANGMI
jgi:hypothetical protein